MMIVIVMCSVVVIFFIAIAVFADYKAEVVQDRERQDTRNVRVTFNAPY